MRIQYASFLSFSRKLSGTDTTSRGGFHQGRSGNSARLMGTLKQAGMIAVLALLAEGFFVLCGALRQDDAHGSAAKGTVKLLTGATLCSSGLMLLYSLGRRDER